MRGRFSGRRDSTPRASSYTEWCERRLLARIHRLTLDGLRRRIQPVPPEVYWQYLLDASLPARRAASGRGELGLREAIAQLQGFELPAGVWENKVLAPRVADYDPQGSTTCSCRASWFGAACARRGAMPTATRAWPR